MTKQTIEELKKLQDDLLAKHLPEEILSRLRAIQITLELVKGQSVKIDEDRVFVRLTNSGQSAHENVIRATVDLSEKIGPIVRNMQIIAHLQRTGTYWGNGDDIGAAVGAILWAEKGRKNPRIQKVGRGLWQKAKPLLNLKLRQPEEQSSKA